MRYPFNIDQWVMWLTEMKRNALWCVCTRNFSAVIKIPSVCHRNFCQIVVNMPIAFPSSQLLRQFAGFTFRKMLQISQNVNLLAELVEEYYSKCELVRRIYTIYYGRNGCSRSSWPICVQQIAIAFG